VRDPLAVIVGDDLRERGRRREPRRRQLDRLERDRLLGLAAEPKPLADVGGGCAEVGERRLLVGVPPAPVLADPRGGYQ
jgi:hypothetical protein